MQSIDIDKGRRKTRREGKGEEPWTGWRRGGPQQTTSGVGTTTGRHSPKREEGGAEQRGAGARQDKEGARGEEGWQAGKDEETPREGEGPRGTEERPQKAEVKRAKIEPHGEMAEEVHLGSARRERQPRAKSLGRGRRASRWSRAAAAA